ADGPASGLRPVSELPLSVHVSSAACRLAVWWHRRTLRPSGRSTMSDTTGKRKRTYQRNKGRFKRCDCPRRQWSRCSHEVWGKFCHAGRDHRVNLARQFQKRNVSWSEAEGLLDVMRAQIRAG